MGDLRTGQSPPNTVVSPQAGMYIQPFVMADASGNVAALSSSGQLNVAPVEPVSVLSYADGTQAATNVGDSFSMLAYTSAAIYVTFTSFTGGTTPDITFYLQGLGTSSVWYTLWSNTTPITAGPTTIVANIGPGQSGGTASSGNGGFSVVFPLTCRFGWSTTGTPTSWTGSASVTIR